MSASNQPEDLDEPSKYAPKWIREAQAKQRTAELRRLPNAPQLVVTDNDPPSGASRWQNDPSFEGDLAIKRMRIQRSLEPERLTEPEWKEPSRFPFGMLLRASAAIGVAVLGALAYVGELPLPFAPAPQETAARETIGSDLRVPVPAESSRLAKSAERVGEVRPGAPAWPEPASARPEAPPKAMEPADAPRAVKPVTLAATNASPWPSAPGPATVAPAAPAPAAPVPVTRHLPPEEIETLIQRGEGYISQGDFSAARSMLKRAAEAGSSRAALALGATYDPEMLRRMGVVAFQADPAQARAWYEKAAALGSGEASRRLAAFR